MSKKKRKSYSREFKVEAVRLIAKKGYSIAEASRNLGVEYSVLRRWKQQLTADPQDAFPGKRGGSSPPMRRCAASNANWIELKRSVTS